MLQNNESNLSGFEKKFNPPPEIKALKDTISIQASEINKLKTRIGDEETLFKYMASEISTNVVPTPYIPSKRKTRNTNGKIIEDVGVILSDLHLDSPVRPERVQGYECYDYRAACHRSERVVDTIITHCFENLTGYKFDTLWLFLNGDIITGGIHNMKQHSQWRNLLISSIKAGQLIGSMVIDLSQHFNKINVIFAPGNHGRLTEKIDWKSPLENWDYMSAEYARSMCKNIKHVDWSIPDAWSQCVNIKGYNFFVQHGHQIKQNTLSIPYYGIERRTRRLTSLGAVKNIVYNYFIQGHRHTNASIPHPTGEVLMNGAYLATDEYVFESMGEYNEPHQLLFGIHEKYGVTWRLPISLRCSDWETKEREVPSKYNFGD
jgi:hypothetical protein